MVSTARLQGTDRRGDPAEGPVAEEARQKDADADRDERVASRVGDRCHGGLSGGRGEALVVHDPLVRRLAEPLRLPQRAHQQGDGLLVSSGLGERENLCRGGDPVRAERAVLVQQPPVAVVRDERVGIAAELERQLGAARLEIGADFRLPRRVRLEQVAADVDPQPLEAAEMFPSAARLRTCFSIKRPRDSIRSNCRIMKMPRPESTSSGTARRRMSRRAIVTAPLAGAGSGRIVRSSASATVGYRVEAGPAVHHSELLNFSTSTAPPRTGA